MSFRYFCLCLLVCLIIHKLYSLSYGFFFVFFFFYIFVLFFFFFFFQAEDGIRDPLVTGVQTCALPIYKLFPAMEQPAAAFVMVTGIFAALKVLKLSESTDHYIAAGSTVAFSLVIFWGLLRAFNAVLDHAHEVALERQMGVAAFMPWIKKT